MSNHPLIDRRALLATGALLTTTYAVDVRGTVPLHDFAFQDGRWAVHHRKLCKRLEGSVDWFEFEGATTAGPLMGGIAGYEDNILDDPGGRYRAEGLRRFDPGTGLWSIWWWDERVAEIDPPVVGRFQDGVGTFFGDSELGGKPIRVRYIWDMPTAGSPRWQQAFSADEGRNWETNWIMEFRR